MLSECLKILKNPAEDAKARFEWIDGVLVKAMETGKWLVLDNANLCSSSILDRLNSLLEPNGYINIDEHHAPDGEARTVRPHAKFRLFITMDPRHGELSRAMRNRAIELFMPERKHEVRTRSSLSISKMSCESHGTRFRMLQYLGKSHEARNNRYDANAVASHLSLADLQMLESWRKQTLAGLINVDGDVQQALNDTVQSFVCLRDVVAGEDNSLAGFYTRSTDGTLTDARSQVSAGALRSERRHVLIVNPSVARPSAHQCTTAVFGREEGAEIGRNVERACARGAARDNRDGSRSPDC